MRSEMKSALQILLRSEEKVLTTTMTTPLSDQHLLINNKIILNGFADLIY